MWDLGSCAGFFVFFFKIFIRGDTKVTTANPGSGGQPASKGRQMPPPSQMKPYCVLSECDSLFNSCS